MWLLSFNFVFLVIKTAIRGCLHPHFIFLRADYYQYQNTFSIKWINSTVVVQFAMVLAKSNKLLRLFSMHY